MLSRLAEMGFDAQPYRLNASCYGLPQNRSRLFILCLRRPTRTLRLVQSYDEFFKGVTEFLRRCECGGPSLVEALLPGNHSWVLRELATRQKRPGKSWDSVTMVTHRAEWARIGVRWQPEASPLIDSVP